MTTKNATSIHESRGAAVMGASRRLPLAAAGRGADALARVSRGLVGGPVGMRAPTADRTLDDAVEIVISRPGRSPLASPA